MDTASTHRSRPSTAKDTVDPSTPVIPMPGNPSDPSKKKKKRHDKDKDGDDDDDDKHRHHGDRNKLLECALARRYEELESLNQAFEDAIQGKKPLDPPTHYSTSVQRAWLNSVDPHDYRARLEQLIDQAEIRLEKLEERL